ncbi:hypothetical protein CONLIGDRAFT_643431 [Coniochaeta ligniaria NRRL 30616]|uniref:Nephrocystin 3-like N-terminal domain-containing protein n=1 Tax=Coniochaeta ligniaria NRRL 30616 TaxID=1408157 RepID=A0A1J7JQ41_9PEZI|nr:hypothetical protein CONLIGDRAFT_643431 [Coniochaeta ligniaria NRRL 30616]
MKYLGHNKEVHEALKEWAGDNGFIIVRSFFYTSSDTLPKTLEGFYRTILFHTLRQQPELITAVFPEGRYSGLPSTAGYRLIELEDAFEILLQQTRGSKSHRYCYFLDGLDEHDADSLGHRKLAKLFLAVLGNSGNSIEFHKLTRSDLVTFATSSFTNDLAAPEFQNALETCLRLVTKIADMAHGVFLWSTLVVRSLLNGALNHEDGMALEQRLSDCPENLSSLSRKMLSSVDNSSSVQRRSSMILYIATYWPFPGPLMATTYCWLEEAKFFQGGVHDFPFDRFEEIISELTFETMLDRVRKLLHSTTQVRDYLLNEWATKSMHPVFPLQDAALQAFFCLRYFCHPNDDEYKPSAGESKKLHDVFDYVDVILEAADSEDACYLLQQLRQLVESPDSGLKGHVFGDLPHLMSDYFPALPVDRYPDFIHWLALEGIAPGPTLCRLLDTSTVPRPIPDCEESDSYESVRLKPNLLLAASIGANVALTRHLLQHGHHPSDQVPIRVSHSDADSVFVYCGIQDLSSPEHPATPPLHGFDNGGGEVRGGKG